MKKRILISTLTLLLMTLLHQCINNEELYGSTVPKVERYLSFDELFEETRSDTIQFVIENPMVDTIFIGARGTKLVFPANSCSLETTTAQSPFTVDLVEIYNRSEIIANNIETVATPDLLVSGGMFYVQVKDANGNTLNMSGVNVILPSQTDAMGYENSMLQFTGFNQTTSSGSVLSWGVNEQSEISYDSATGEYTLYDILGGWTNCDAFGNWSTEEKTQFKVKVTNALDYTNTKVFFAVKDLTTIVNIYTVDEEYVKTYDNSIPLGIEGTLVAISLEEEGGVLSFASQNVTIKGDDIFEIKVSEGNISGLKGVFSSLD